jgi:signal transduction histidine kinase
MEAAVWLGVPIAAGGYLVLVIAGPLRPESVASHYALLSPAHAVTDLVAGVGMLGVGTAAWLSRRYGVGLLAILAGMAWFGADWAGDSDVPTVVRASGMVVATLALPLLVHLVLLVSGASRRRTLAVSGLLYVTMTALSIAWLAWYVPGHDPRCFELCDLDLLTSFGYHQTARLLSDGWQALTLVTGVGLVAWAVAMGARRPRAAARRMWPSLLGAAAVGVTWAAWAVALLQPSRLVPPGDVVQSAAFVARAVAMLILAGGIGAWLLSRSRTVAAVRAISDRLTPFPGGGTLRSQLAAAMSDPDLRLLYTVPGEGSLIDPGGHPVELAGDVTNVTRITHGGEVVALMVTSRPVAGDGAAAAIGSAVRLALANERLLAAVRHELLELRASRQRLVQAADAERHHLERGLHDGAQQSLVSLLHELTLAGDQARAAGDTMSAARLTRAVAATDAAIDALRLVARGIHDPVLAESGLLAALDVLSIDAPVPVSLDLPPELACSAEAEATAWRVVSDAVDHAARSGATGVTGGVAVAAGRLTVTLVLEGVGRAFDLLPSEDRVGAAGGHLRSGWRPGSILELRAELPCA